MTFQAYIDAVETKSGMTIDQIHKLATQEKVLNKDMKASELIIWLKTKFDLGRGHSMAVWALFVSKGWVETKNSKVGKR